MYVFIKYKIKFLLLIPSYNKIKFWIKLLIFEKKISILIELWETYLSQTSSNWFVLKLKFF